MTTEATERQSDEATKGKPQEPGRPRPDPLRRSVAPSLRRSSFHLTSTLTFLLLLSYAVLVVFPMFWLLYTSLKTDSDIFYHPFKLPSATNLQWGNFTRAWTKGMFDRYFLNSVLLTASSVGVTVFLSAMTAYALARFKFLGGKPIYFYFLAGSRVRPTSNPMAALGCVAGAA